GPGRPSSPPLFLLTTWMRPDPVTQVVGGAGSGLTPGAQSPLRSPGGGGGRGQSVRAVARVRLPSCLPSALPSRLPSLTSRLEGTRGGSPEGNCSLVGRRVHVDAGTAHDIADTPAAQRRTRRAASRVRTCREVLPLRWSRIAAITRWRAGPGASRRSCLA